MTDERRDQIRRLLGRWGREAEYQAEMDAMIAHHTAIYEAERERIIGGGGVARWTETPRAEGIGDPVPAAVEQLGQLTLDHQERIAAIRARQEEFRRLVLAVDEIVEGLELYRQRVIRLRYCEGLEWEDVVDQMPYERTRCVDLEREAVDTVGEYIGAKTPATFGNGCMIQCS